MNKRILFCIALIISFLSISSVSRATHIMGGSINYEYLGLDTTSGYYKYRVTIYLYRLCDNGSALLPIDMNLGVYQDDTLNMNGDKPLVLNTVLPLILQQPITPPSGNDSCTFAPNVCVEEGVYQDIVSVPPNNLGYYFISDRCCRNGNIVNLNNPGGDGEAYFAKAPAPSIVNSSPTFAVAPVPFICNTDTATVLNQAFDPDGDSLVYSFEVPYNGISTGMNPNPNPPVLYPFPIQLVQYAGGFSLAQPFGATGYCAMNSATGLAQYYCPNQGFYVIAVQISEYRNGVLIGISRRDIQIIVIPCPINPAPVLSSTTSQTTFTIQEGDSLCFNTTFIDPNGDSIYISHTGTIFNNIITNPPAIFTDSLGDSTATGQFCWATSCDQGNSVPYQFSVFAQDNGCPAKISTVVYTINVQNTITPAAIIGPDTLCSLNGFGVIYYASPPIAGYTYFWVIGNGTIIGSNTGDSVLVNFNGTGSSELTVFGVNHNGCLSDSLTYKIHVSQNSIAEAGPDVTLCSGDTAVLGTTSTAGYIYSWTPNLHLSSTTISNPYFTWINSGTTPVTFTYIVTTNLNGCVDEDTVTVTVNPAPPPSAGPDKTICSGDSVPIGTPNVAGSIYSWTPSTGLSSTTISDPIVTLTDTTGLPYTLQYVVTVQNSYGCSSIDTVNVTVNVLPVAVAGNDTSFCSGSGVNIGGPTVVGYIYAWSPSGGLSDSTISNPVVTFTNISGQNDTLYYILNVSQGSCADQDTIMVIVRPSPVSNAGPDTLICGSGTVQLGTTSTSGYTYTWTPSTGLSSDVISDPLLTVSSTGNTPDTLIYIVTTNLNGCITSDTVQIIVSPGPTASAGPDTSYCSGNSVMIGSASQANYIYTWTGTGLSSTTISNPIVTFVNSTGVPDTQYYVVTVNLFGCIATDSVMVIINPSPVSNAGLDQFICSGGTVTLGTTTTSGYTYTWTPATGLSDSTISNPDLTLTNVGSIPDTLTYIVTTNLNGCSTSDTVQVIISPVPTAIAGPDTVICSGTSIVIGTTSTANYIYTWTPGTYLNSTTISNPTSTPINLTTANDTVTYIVTTDLFGCFDSDTMQIIVKPNPIANAGQDVTVCGGDTVYLGTSSTLGYTYNWTPSTGLSSDTISNPFIIVTNTSGSTTTVTYTVSVMLNGCITTDSVTITINPQPNVTASANPISICIGDSTTLTGTGATSYSWALSTAPNNPIGTGATLVVSPIVTTTYILTGTNGFACSNTNTVTVTVNALPNVQIASAPLDSMCVGDTLTLSATGATNYTWSILSGSTIGSGSSIQVFPVTTTTYVVVGTDGNTCSNSDTITIIVNPAATLSNISGNTSVCPGVTGVQYWVNSPNPNSTYVWTITNGTITNGQNSDTITVDWSTTSGIGTITVIEVTDHGCQSDPVTLSVTINVFLTPVAPTGPTTLCANQAQGIIYTLPNTPGSTYNWFTNGGVIAGGNGTNIATVNWTVTGPQVVALWYEETSITSVDTCFGTSDTLYITINPSPATGPISGPINVCVSDSGGFSVVSTANSTYNWLINGGTILSGNGTNSITADWTAGTVIVSVVETNSYGCVGDTVSLTVTVHALPTVSAGTDVSVCNGQGVQLNASGGVSYTWSPPTGLSNTAIPNPIASPTTATNYIVYVTDTFGCKNSDTVLVSVNALPVITLTPNSPLCINSSIQLNANANGATSYQWSPPTGLSSTTISNPVANPTTTTTYTVIVTDNNTCVDSSKVTITVNPLPTITASVNTDTICAGATANLSANGGVSYSWLPTTNLNNSSSGNPVATAPTGISNVISVSYTVTGTDAHGCSNTANVSFDVNPEPEASFTVDDANLDSLTCLGYTARLINNSVNANSYQWIFPNGSSTEFSPQVQLNLSGNNNIILIATNEMCVDSSSLDFASTAIAQLFTKVPNVFTPNGDTKNECFDFGSHYNLKDCSQWEVYNRWGEKVFTSSPSKACWNGTKDGTGKELPSGTYYILVNIKGQSYKGSITLIRKAE